MVKKGVITSASIIFSIDIIISLLITFVNINRGVWSTVKKKFNKMLIGELSRRCDLSRDTIRYYEKQGLIAVGRKERRFNNYKEYSDETLNRLMSIKRIKSLGFTLNEVSVLLDMIDSQQATCSNVSLKVEEKVQLIDEKIKELLNVRSVLLNGLERCNSSGCNPSAPEDNCPIIVNGTA